MTIDRREQQTQAVTLATIADGVLTLTRTDRRITDYVIAGAAREPRTVILDHPRVAGYELASPRDKVTGVTARDYQIRVEVAAGATVTLKVSLERPVSETVVIADLPSTALAAYVTSTEISSPVRAALGHVAALRATLDDKTAAVKALEAELARITTDQARIRENLKVAPARSALARRYLATLTQQEDRITAVDKQLVDARAAVHDAEQALSKYIRALHLG